ncbi:MAG: hypothetical protein DRI61_09055 [Chloroflexi bacterium]|nr:MAG: hypothetical protein DRI61_09055 [Chloroflexota bacterium]HDN80979.1 HEAT repeat domain-containing protein [Chloroflexota bacterium]
MFSVEKILRKLAEEKHPWRSRYLPGLSGLSRAEAEAFKNIWCTLAVEERRRIISSLVEVGERDCGLDFSYLFRLCLEDEDEEVRLQALEGLWEDEDPGLIVPLVKLLRNDASSRVRAAAAASLGRFMLKAEMEKLDQYYIRLMYETLLEVAEREGEELEVRRRAIEALAYSGDERVARLIEMAYNHPDEKMRVSAIFAMGRNAHPRWRSILLNELENPDAAIRYEAARACGEMEVKEAVAVLSKLTQDPDFEVREAAVWALGNIGGREAKRILYGLLDGDDDAIKEAVEEALEVLEFLSNPLGFTLFEEFDEDEF